MSFNLLVLFGAGMSEGEIDFVTWFAVIASFVLWGLFYFLQFARFNNKIWRISWLDVMVILLLFWETGLGTSIGRMIV